MLQAYLGVVRLMVVEQTSNKTHFQGQITQKVSTQHPFFSGELVSILILNNLIS